MSASRALTAAFTAAVLAVALLAALVAASSARAAGTVRVTAALPEADVGEQSVDVTPPLLALYVDSGGAAHVAWVASGDQTIDLCTIPAGGSSCEDQSTLATDANAANGGEISSIKYLPNDAGGTAYLAVGIDQMNPPPAIDRFSLDPGSEEELFVLGQSSGLATGEVAYVSDGDVILEPDGTGVDVVGDSQTGSGCCYEFESLTAGGTDSGVVSLANQNLNQNLIDITTLPEGQTAAIVESFNGRTEAIGMYVQTTEGGPFGPLRPLGITGPAEAVASPGGSYVLNVEANSKTAIDGIYADPLELYRFRGLSLVPVASVGASVQGTATPIFEDSTGDLYTAWYANPDFDGCNPPALPAVACLMYRRISTGDLLGGKIIVTTTSNQQEYLGPIGADAQGAGWMLTWTEPFRGSDQLSAVPLPSSASAGTPTVSASAVSVPLSCAGSSGSNCGLTAVLVSPTSGAAADAGSAGAAAAHVRVLAHLTRKLQAGRSTKFVLKLDRLGRTVLASRHRLTAQLEISQIAGDSKTPTSIISKKITFSHRRR